MVDTDAELAAAGAAHEVGFDLFGAKVVEGLDEIKEGAHFDCAVDLGELGEETREECAREEGEVTGIGCVAGAEGEGIEGGFEQVIEGLDRGWREPEDVSRELLDMINICTGVARDKDTYGILEKTGAGGWPGEAE